MAWSWNTDGDNQSQYVQKILYFNDFCDSAATEVFENYLLPQGIGN